MTSGAPNGPRIGRERLEAIIASRDGKSKMLHVPEDDLLHDLEYQYERTAALERERDALRAALERQRNHATLVLAATCDVGMGDESAEKALDECGRLGSTMLKEAQAALATAPYERKT